MPTAPNLRRSDMLRKPVIAAQYRLGVCIALIAMAATLAAAQAPASASGANQEAEAQLGALSRYEGQIVRQIDFRGISGSKPQMLLRLMLVRENEPLERGQLQQTIKTLYATGRFSKLDVEA